ncbi:uncharacterized protein LOC105829241 [Monomorium pharaonis]|uniref:uncharacterized protein LOC105829241 n=1 Tax=Monomorium pharaonis TaxID=307658 RepID=UPI001745FFEE|nr:uncharacterized protein LOC105829241 [Monomorium pharaonis]
MEEIHMQIEDDSSSIEHILRPISYISWLLGVGVARPRNCSKAVTIIIRIVYLAVCFVNIVYTVIDLSNVGSVFALESDIFELIYFTNLVIIYVATFYYIYHGIRQYDKWPELMDRIKDLDQEINRETLMNDRPVKNVEVLAILTIFAWYPLFPIVHVLYYYFTNLENIFMSDLIYYLITARSLINSFVFDIVVYVLYHRLRTINQLIGQLNKLSEAPLIALKIKQIRELHNGICDIVVMINDIHGLHLLLCSVNCFTVVVSTLLTVYLGIVEKNFAFILLSNCNWIMHTMQFGLMCWICTLARQESDKTGINIYAVVRNCTSVNHDKINRVKNQSYLDMPTENPDSEQDSKWSSSHNLNCVVIENLLRKNIDQDCIRNEINDFSIQLQQYRVTFTACGFFEINNVLFSACVKLAPHLSKL